jgi:hypothetical protein
VHEKPNNRDQLSKISLKELYLNSFNLNKLPYLLMAGWHYIFYFVVFCQTCFEVMRNFRRYDLFLMTTQRGIGYITKNYSVTVHRNTSGDADQQHEDQKMTVDWAYLRKG